jgi:hypothetical protein
MSERQTFEDCFALLIVFNEYESMPLDKLAKLVEKAQKAQEKGEWSKVRLDEWYDEDTGSFDIALVGERMETEKEMKARLKLEKLDAKERAKYDRENEKAERETYERLKAKFEGK